MIQFTKCEENGITFYRVDNDRNGNPRYVFHFLELSDNYDRAVKLAKKVQASPYKGKWYGGGFVLQSYNLGNTARDIKAIKEN